MPLPHRAPQKPHVKDCNDTGGPDPAVQNPVTAEKYLHPQDPKLRNKYSEINRDIRFPKISRTGAKWRAADSGEVV